MVKKRPLPSVPHVHIPPRVQVQRHSLHVAHGRRRVDVPRRPPRATGPERYLPPRVRHRRAVDNLMIAVAVAGRKYGPAASLGGGAYTVDGVGVGVGVGVGIGGVSSVRSGTGVVKDGNFIDAVRRLRGRRRQLRLGLRNTRQRREGTANLLPPHAQGFTRGTRAPHGGGGNLAAPAAAGLGPGEAIVKLVTSRGVAMMMATEFPVSSARPVPA